MIIFESLLKWASFFEAAGADVKIGASLKPKATITCPKPWHILYSYFHVLNLNVSFSRVRFQFAGKGKEEKEKEVVDFPCASTSVEKRPFKIHTLCKKSGISKAIYVFSCWSVEPLHKLFLSWPQKMELENLLLSSLYYCIIMIKLQVRSRQQI